MPAVSTEGYSKHSKILKMLKGDGHEVISVMPNILFWQKSFCSALLMTVLKTYFYQKR